MVATSVVPLLPPMPTSIRLTTLRQLHTERYTVVNDIPSLWDLALSPELEWGDSRFDHISTAFLDDNVGTSVVELGRDIFIRIDGILALNGDGISWTTCRSGMNNGSEGHVESRQSRTRVSRGRSGVRCHWGF